MTDTKKTKSKSLGGLDILDFPNRTLPELIEDLLQKKIPIRLLANGYLIGGYYDFKFL